MNKLMDEKDVVTEFLKEEFEKTKAALEYEKSRKDNIDELIDKANRGISFQSGEITAFLNKELEGLDASICTEELKIFQLKDMMKKSCREFTANSSADFYKKISCDKYVDDSSSLDPRGDVGFLKDIYEDIKDKGGRDWEDNNIGPSDEYISDEGPSVFSSVTSVIVHPWCRKLKKDIVEAGNSFAGSCTSGQIIEYLLGMLRYDKDNVGKTVRNVLQSFRKNPPSGFSFKSTGEGSQRRYLYAFENVGKLVKKG